MKMTEKYKLSEIEQGQNNNQRNNDLINAQRYEAIKKLSALSCCQPMKNCLPEATTLLDMKTGNVFAEPGT